MLFRALLPEHAKTVDIKALLEYFLDLLALQPFLLLDLRFALRRLQLVRQRAISVHQILNMLLKIFTVHNKVDRHGDNCIYIRGRVAL